MNIPSSVLSIVHEQHPHTSELLRKALSILEHNNIRSTPKGWCAKSSSLDRTEYCITEDGSKCGCKAGQYDLLCHHRLALYIRQELFAQAKDNMRATGEKQVDIIGQREDKVREQSKPREYWWEELV